ncbi:hypothetical protein C1H46_022700 [Malus baccata]|uniref:Uncharacterized protein n=1 Tax=Malus baccata TaxID=106549 RepID=A0A540LZH1_MALBA|nr:hypothetical protein C1H46_022700 [Malus baccata]
MVLLELVHPEHAGGECQYEASGGGGEEVEENRWRKHSILWVSMWVFETVGDETPGTGQLSRPQDNNKCSLSSLSPTASVVAFQ